MRARCIPVSAICESIPTIASPCSLQRTTRVRRAPLARSLALAYEPQVRWGGDRSRAVRRRSTRKQPCVPRERGERPRPASPPRQVHFALAICFSTTTTISLWRDPGVQASPEHVRSVWPDKGVQNDRSTDNNTSVDKFWPFGMRLLCYYSSIEYN